MRRCRPARARGFGRARLPGPPRGVPGGRPPGHTVEPGLRHVLPWRAGTSPSFRGEEPGLRTRPDVLTWIAIASLWYSTSGRAAETDRCRRAHMRQLAAYQYVEPFSTRRRGPGGGSPTSPRFPDARSSSRRRRLGTPSTPRLISPGRTGRAAGHPASTSSVPGRTLSLDERLRDDARRIPLTPSRAACAGLDGRACSLGTRGGPGEARRAFGSDRVASFVCEPVRAWA